jgi:hypothetical protein
MTMSDERAAEAVGLLRAIRDALSVCTFCLITLTIMAAGAALKVFGGPFG